MEEVKTSLTVSQALENVGAMVWNTFQAGYGSETKLICPDGDILFVNNKEKMKGEMLIQRKGA